MISGDLFLDIALLKKHFRSAKGCAATGLVRQEVGSVFATAVAMQLIPFNASFLFFPPSSLSHVPGGNSQVHRLQPQLKLFLQCRGQQVKFEAKA